MRAAVPCTLVLLLLAAAPAVDAGTLRLEFRDGYVSISAVSVPLQQVLSEWARLGQTRVVNAEKLAGTPLTLELTNVPEKQALETLLRSVPGYLAARRATLVPGGSQFDRIVVMPGTVAPPSPSAAAPPPPLPPAPMPAMVEDQDEPVPQEAPDQAGAAEQEQDPEQPQPQPQPQQPQTLPSPGVQPLPPAPQGQNDGDGVPPQPPAGPGEAPGGGAVVSPTPGQLPLPPAKPPNQQDQ